ncbi:hypothetical protein GJ496_003516, partial [Pomphorhynchus laevis]
MSRANDPPQLATKLFFQSINPFVSKFREICTAQMKIDASITREITKSINFISESTFSRQSNNIIDLVKPIKDKDKLVFVLSFISHKILKTVLILGSRDLHNRKHNVFIKLMVMLTDELAKVFLIFEHLFIGLLFDVCHTAADPTESLLL